jgi:hypothetical protein
MNHWVMDYETLKTCFVAVFTHYKSDMTKVFIVCEFQNDTEDFINFLMGNVKDKEWHISYNGLGFDSQVTQHILVNRDKLRALSGAEVAGRIYEYAQGVIALSNAGEFLEYKEKQLAIKQIDVFKLNHWDNRAKRSSLKWIQFSMDWHNVQDMPLHHTHEIQSMEEVHEIVRYCINDVLSTKKIMELSAEQIRLRKTLTEAYNIPLYNASEPRISKELFLHFLEAKTGIKKYDLKQGRTYRGIIYVADILLSSIQFQTPTFQALLSKFKEQHINPNETKNAFHHHITYRGVETHFGLGGIHGAKSSDVYTPSEGMIIMSSDVTSFYPNLGIRNQWAPGHITKEAFCEQYEWFFEERKKIPKSNPLNYVYKIILNSTYGLTNDENSFLYDPQMTMQITINGQLSLAMLYEMLAEGVPGAIPLMQNTDGLEMMIPERYKEKYLEICTEWEQKTNLLLEHEEYQKLILADVNNYIAVYKWKEVDKETYDKLSESPHSVLKEEEGKYYHAKTKCKGRFEFEGLALHKNKSNLIVRKALFHYFVHGTDPEEYLKSNRNIFDYCSGVKIRGNWKFHSIGVDNSVVVSTPLQKTLRYYISNKGCKIIKVNQGDGREIQTESGKWLQTVFNVYEIKEWEDYDINEQYYLNAINKEIKNITPYVFDNQLTLNF